MDVMNEQGNKNMDLSHKKEALASLSFNESTRLNIANNYLMSKKKISQNVRGRSV
ncbi:hypothetical protein [Bacillus atrophaeus]|uniref:hypothetical protein n=1 Tax=Bacillus atrophaeus TaxID=1452 RepID=UPI002282AE41|nr:hypothetical protein [Bacillus atrophaeus]MCY8934275.1 hypothetical protein [Bacillus atrophaeus]MCY8940760.1 hypothetical protein [Bacillus atrophaeus]MCY8946412.1 hypothetical protein [Bacillus atrophaeus]